MVVDDDDSGAVLFVLCTGMAIAGWNRNQNLEH